MWQTLVVLSGMLLAGCLGSGSCGASCGADDDPVQAPCAAMQTEQRHEQAPGLSQRATAMIREDGNRSWRWDLLVADVCPQQGGTAGADLIQSGAPDNCPTVTLRATLTTGVTEAVIALEGETRQQGHVTFTPQRPDLGPGPATVAVSLTARLVATGLDAQDEQCLDAQLPSFALWATFAPVRAA